MSGVIVVRKKNQDLPEEYLSKVFSEHKTCMGAAVVVDGELGVNSGPAGGTVEGIKEALSEVKDKDVVFFFGTLASGAPEDEVQPYKLLEDADGNPLIVGFFDGSFPSYAKAGSSHSDAWFLANEFLRPLFKDYYESKESDIALVNKDISKPVFKMQVEKTWQDRGTITLLTKTGDIHTFSLNDKSSDFPWGWVSNTMGFGIAAAPAKKGWWGNKKPTQPVATEKPVANPIVPKMPQLPVAPAKTDTVIPTAATLPKLKCPLTITKERKIKGWYREHCGTVPPNYQDHPDWPVTIGRSLEEIGAIMASVRQPDDLTNAKIQQERKKDVTPHHIPQATVGESESLPIITAEQKKAISEKFPASIVAQVLDQNSNKIFPPDQIQGVESKWPKFTEGCGYKGLEDLFGWKRDRLIKLTKEFPEPAADLIMEFRAALIGMINAGSTRKAVETNVTSAAAIAAVGGGKGSLMAPPKKRVAM